MGGRSCSGLRIWIRRKREAGVIDLTVDLLSWLGMDWDEGPHIQSADLVPYREAMQLLASRSRVYPSSLTRTQIESAASAPQEGSHEVLYPASLRPSQTPLTFNDSGSSWRLIVQEVPVEFGDAFAGPQRQFPSRTIGDFVVWTRRDQARPGQPAYQLAVVVDDHRQGITQVVRGDDLLDSAARQLLIYRALSLAPEPAYTHLPLVRGQDGRRLAKRHGDTRLDTYRLRGVSPERVIGLIGHWSGIPGPRRPMSALEFRQEFDIRTMSTEPVTFTAEDDAWLASS